MPILELRTATATVRLAPELGGALTSFDAAGTPIMRSASDATLAAHDVKGVACYPLVPYSNRIRDAALHFAGRTFALAHNFGTHPHAIHGVGWQRRWTVAEASDTRVRLALDHDARGENARAWPWPFRATQAFRLTDAAQANGRTAAILVATLTLTNTGVEPFPFGLGFHPFFAKDAATKLGFHATRVWRNDATGLPKSRVAPPPPWRFGIPRAVDPRGLDNVFVGWPGTATIVDDAAGRSCTLEADRALAFVIVYSPPGAAFVAVEPVTHETDAFNRTADGATGTGMLILAPGQAFSCTMRIAAAVVACAPTRLAR
jgi:aldose 1-epimerase